MQRVKKSEMKFDTWVKPDGYAACMDCWKTYMGTDDRDLSASRMRLEGGASEEEEGEQGDEMPVGYESDPYGDQRKADMKIGQATDAMIESLKPCEQWAIRKKYQVTNVWNFPQIDLLQIIPIAEHKLEEMLRKNIATAVMF